MLSFLLTQCTDCNTLDDALCRVEGSLAQYGKDGWQNITYMVQKPVPINRIKQLMYYKGILENLKWNQALYCPPFDMQQVISRAKFVAGSITPIGRRWKLPTYTTTTTTTTTTTSTTSTSTTTTTTTSTTHTTTTTTSTTTTTTSTHGPSTFSVTSSVGTAGFMNIVVNGTTVVHQAGTGSGVVTLHNGDSVFAFLGMTVAGIVHLIVTDVTTSTVISNTSTSGLAPGTSHTWTANGDQYSIVGTCLPTTTTTTTSTTTTTTTT